MTKWLSPECRDREHRKCYGMAWDEDKDEPTICDCPCGCPIPADKV